LPPASQPAKLVTRPERELIRIRLRYRKTGDLRFVGHLDLVNLFRRAARRADLPLHYSLGFHPQPSLSFGPPLPLGYLGLGEWLDMGLDRWQEPKEVVRLLNEYLPLAGVAVEAGREVPLTTPALNERIQAGEYLLEFPTQAGSQAWETRVQAFLSATEVKGTQWSKRGLVSVNLRPSVNALQLGTVDGKTAQLKLLHDTSVAGAAKVPALVEHFCEQGPEAAWAVRVTRVASGMLYNNTITIP
jgi:radical SAM-linked protein